MAFSKEDWAHLIARAAWCVSFGLLWVGLLPRGWYTVAFTGSDSYGMPAYKESYSAAYGLFSIEFRDAANNYVVDYNKWVNTANNPDSYLKIHGARVAAVVACVAACLTCLSYFRSVISKVQVQIFTTKRAFGLALVDLACTLCSLASFGNLLGSPVFAIMCTYQGCFPLPVQGVSQSTLSYSWGLWVLRAGVQALLCIALFFVAKYTKVEVESPHEEYPGLSKKKASASGPSGAGADGNPKWLHEP